MPDGPVEGSAAGRSPGRPSPLVAALESLPRKGYERPTPALPARVAVRGPGGLEALAAQSSRNRNPATTKTSGALLKGPAPTPREPHQRPTARTARLALARPPERPILPAPPVAVTRQLRFPILSSHYPYISIGAETGHPPRTHTSQHLLPPLTASRPFPRTPLRPLSPVCPSFADHPNDTEGRGRVVSDNEQREAKGADRARTTGKRISRRRVHASERRANAHRLVAG
jgi:hypothetical protein